MDGALEAPRGKTVLGPSTCSTKPCALADSRSHRKAPLSRERRAAGQFRPLVHRVFFVNVRVFRLAHPGNRIERQAEPHGRIARNQKHRFGADKPCAARPGTCAIHVVFAS